MLTRTVGVILPNEVSTVSTPAWHDDDLRSIPCSDQACYIRCKNLALNIRDCVSLVGRGGSVVRAPLQNLGKFVYSTLPVSFG